MKKLLCIVGGMNVGGAETFMMKIFRKIDREKYQVDFAVGFSQKGFYDDEILSCGGSIFHITPKSQGVLKNYSSIKKLVKLQGYNSVLRISQNSLSALELRAAKKGGAKNLIFRSSNSNTDDASMISRTIHKAFRFMPRLYANVKIAPSEKAAEFMFGRKAMNRKDVFLLRNGVDLGVFQFDKNGREKLRREFQISDDVKVIGHVGRFMAQKNHKFLLNVFAEIYKREKNSVLLLVGCGQLEEEIKNQARELGILSNVIFTGVRSDIPQILSAMDVFVFPSLYEGMPNTVIEAQATGLPCVIADTITREANITGLVDYLSLSDSYAHWAEVALEKSNLERKDTRQDFIDNKYDIESVVKQFVSLVFGD